MSVTSELVGNIGGYGYGFATSAAGSYRLPPTSKGWTIMFARWNGTGSISYQVTSAKTGAVVAEFSSNVAVVLDDISPEEAMDGLVLNIRNSTSLRITVANVHATTRAPVTPPAA